MPKTKHLKVSAELHRKMKEKAAHLGRSLEETTETFLRYALRRFAEVVPRMNRHTKNNRTTTKH